jgi:hypothetical protein
VKEVSDVERARAQVAHDRKHDDMVQLRERHEEQQRAHMAVKLTQARADAAARDRAGVEEPEEEAEGEVVIVKVTPAAQVTKQVTARRQESGGGATGSGTAKREVEEKIAREKKKAQEEREEKEAKGVEEEDRARVLGFWKDCGQRKLTMVQRLETGRRHLNENQFGELQNMVANTRKEQLREVLSAKDAGAAEEYRKAQKVASALDKAEAAAKQADAERLVTELDKADALANTRMAVAAEKKAKAVAAEARTIEEYI